LYLKRLEYYSDGQPFDFDLNFRLASSTPQVLLHEAAVSRVNARISQSWSKTVKGSLALALERVAVFSQSGKFVPVRLYEATTSTGGKSVITGIIVGASLTEVKSTIVNFEAALNALLVI
jgi:hypothetical protein